MTVRRWVIFFGPIISADLRRRRRDVTSVRDGLSRAWSRDAKGMARMSGAIKSPFNYFGEAGALDLVHAGAPTEPADRTVRVLVFFGAAADR